MPVGYGQGYHGYPYAAPPAYPWPAQPAYPQVTYAPGMRAMPNLVPVAYPIPPAPPPTVNAPTPPAEPAASGGEATLAPSPRKSLFSKIFRKHGSVVPASEARDVDNSGITQVSAQTPAGAQPLPAPTPSMGNAPYSPAPPAAPFSVDAAAYANSDMEVRKAERQVAPGPGLFINECWWVNAAYKMSWFRPGPLDIPLVTSGSAGDNNPGSLSSPNSGIIFGLGGIDFSMSHGIQLEGGFFLDDEHRISMEATLLYYAPNRVSNIFASDPSGNPVIARPVFDGRTGIEQAFLTSLPDAVAGSTTVEATTQVTGYEINTRYNCCINPALHFDWLGGFRFLRLKEKLTIQDRLTAIQNNFITFKGVGIPTGAKIFDEDVFETTNKFYGVNAGARWYWQWNWFTLAAFGKVAVGLTEETVTINGATFLDSALGNASTVGGILAQQSNIGTRTKSVFGVVPEAGFNLGLNLCDHFRLTTGYSFLYWNKAARPGNQIDRNVNTLVVPTDQDFGRPFDGGNGPVFSFKDQGFWIHTFSFGTELYW